MIAHPAEAQEYGELKRRLVQEHLDNMDGYMDGKEPFINEREARAIAWRLSQTP